MHGAWKDSRNQGSSSVSDRLYDLDESHLEASSTREEEWIIRGPQTNQSWEWESGEAVRMQVPGLYPQTQGTRVPGAQPEGVFLTASRGIVIQSASWATSHFWDPVDSMTSYRRYRV